MEPFRLVRQLVGEQARIIRGDRKAFENLQKNLVAASKVLAASDPDVWESDPRNLRALVKLVLSGGPPAVLKNLLGRHAFGEHERHLAEAALAFAEGRKAEAYRKFKEVEHLELEPSLAGHVALVKALVSGAGRSEEAYRLLDEACLLSPGTIVEEAALRRHAPAAASDGRLRRFDALTLRYLRRFPDSLYADSLLSEVALILAEYDYGASPDRTRTFERMLALLPPPKANALLLDVIKESLALGHLSTARFSLEKRQALYQAADAGLGADRVYEAATLILTDEFDAGAAALAQVDTTRLGKTERELADAAGRLVASIAREPQASEAAVDGGRQPAQATGSVPHAGPGQESGGETGEPAGVAGRTIIEAVDKLLEEIDS